MHKYMFMLLHAEVHCISPYVVHTSIDKRTYCVSSFHCEHIDEGVTMRIILQACTMHCLVCAHMYVCTCSAYNCTAVMPGGSSRERIGTELKYVLAFLHIMHNIYLVITAIIMHVTTRMLAVLYTSIQTCCVSPI